MDNENVFGESKRTLAEKLYQKLDNELCDMWDVCDIDEFTSVFDDLLKDYALVLKTGIIE